MSETTPSSTRTGRRYGPGAVALVLLVGMALGGGAAWYLRRPPAAHDHAGAKAEARTQYTCPMHPTIVSDHPGDCPICGMALVRVDGGAAGTSGAATGGEAPGGGASVSGLAPVNIDPQRQQLIGLRTVEATRGPVSASWRTVGKVAVDETRVHHVNIKVGGFVDTVLVDYVGKPVRSGEPLFTIYSPDLLSVQQEYLLALRTRKALSGGGFAEGAGNDLVDAARERLKLWDIPDSEIRRLETTGKPTKTLTMFSPMTGVVTKKDIVMGHRLNEGDMPYEITDLSKVWVLADAYESDLSRIRLGMPATLSLQAFPGSTFVGRVIFIDPILDPKTRTAKVRLEFANPRGELKPEMFGEVTLQAPTREGLRIPADAVIDSGTRKVVFIAIGEGKFQPREVTLGAESGDQVEVLRGVEAGERVVTRANFLVDSESRLRASLAAMGGK
ncbi:MAG: efflux RND transporter periplasmic adaptor subunit [Anaeromyxobacteraceae bacterium]